MKAFLDTSSLLKLYHHEEGTEALHIALSQNLEAIYLSEIARLEFRSAIWKKTRTGEIDINMANTVISCFQQDNIKYQWIYLKIDVIQQASKLLMQYGQEGLRTLDALQLASELTLKKQQNVSFFTADKLLKYFFKQEGLKET